MFSAAYKTRLATALAGAALASALVVSGASADLHAIDAANRAANPPAGDEYQDLRSPDAVDAARAAGDARDATTQDLRSPDTRDQAEGYRPTLEPQPVADDLSEPTGFDPVSAAIGAVAAGGLSLVLMATLGMRRTPRRRPASA